MKYTIDIYQDECCDHPGECMGFEVYSFNPRHFNYKHHKEFCIRPDENGNPVIDRRDEDGIPQKYRSLYDRGLMFFLSCYEHGAIQWGLKGEVHYCRFDTTRIAGVIILDEEIWKGKHFKTKENAAREFLKEYTQWCNSECYGFNIVDEDGEFVDSFGGCLGIDRLFEVLDEIGNFTEGDELVFEGEYSFLSDYYDVGKHNKNVKR